MRESRLKALWVVDVEYLSIKEFSKRVGATAVRVRMLVVKGKLESKEGLNLRKLPMYLIPVSEIEKAKSILNIDKTNLISSREAEDRLGVDPKVIRYAIKTGALRRKKEGLYSWIYKEDVELAYRMAVENVWVKFDWQAVKAERLKNG